MQLQDLFIPIEINVAIAMVIVEVMVLLFVIIVFLYLRVRKYRPYYEANTELAQFIRRYFARTIELTRAYARSIADDADNGKVNAIKRRQNMVARMNWLILERDFVLDGQPDRSYWDDINFRIMRLLTRWQEIEFIDGPPDEKVISASLSDNPAEAVRALSGGRSNDDQNEEIIKQLKERAAYLEKQVHKLGSYKSLYYGLESSYQTLQKSYKKLKQTIMELELKDEDRAKLEKAIAEHETAEQTMESQLKEMETTQGRLNAELAQLEAAFNKLEDERRGDLAKIAELTAQANNDGVMIKGDGAPGGVVAAQEVLDNHDIMMREFKAAVFALNLDMDTKISLEEKIQAVQKANEEIKTCMGVLEMERDRLQQELDTLKPAAQ